MENSELMNIENKENVEIVTQDSMQDKKELLAVKTETMEDKKKLYNALEQCDALVNDSEGTVISLVGVYASEFMKKEKDDKGNVIYYDNDGNVVDEEGKPLTEENGVPKMVKGHWTILFDESGKTYGSASNVFYFAILRVLKAFGDPTKWEKPLEIELTKTQMKGAKGKASTFKLV